MFFNHYLIQEVNAKPTKSLFASIQFWRAYLPTHWMCVFFPRWDVPQCFPSDPERSAVSADLLSSNPSPSSPSPRSALQVPEGSEVHFQPGNFSLACQIQQEALPHGNEHLLNWAQKKYRAVTSFSELMTTQDIYIKVGEGVCEIPKIPNIAAGPGARLPVPF